MGEGIGTPELDKLFKPHGKNQNMEINETKRQASFTTPSGRIAKIPLQQVHLDEVRNRVAEQEQNVKDAETRIGLGL